MFASYPQYEYMLVSSQLVFIMFGMGATLSVADFVDVLRQPRSLLFGAACMNLLAPLLAIAIAKTWSLEPGIAFGLILVSVMPGGSLSNLFTFLAWGNLPLSIALTAVMTLTSVITVPVLLDVFALGYVDVAIQMPVASIIRDVGLYLLAPLCAGMWVARMAPLSRKTISVWSIRIGLLIVFTVVVGSLGSGRIRPAQYGWGVPLAIIVFCVVSQQMSMLPFRLFGWPASDRIAVGIEVTIRNINLALLLNVILFPPIEGKIDPLADGVLFVVLFYGATAMGATFPVIVIHRRRLRRSRQQADIASIRQ